MFRLANYAKVVRQGPRHQQVRWNCLPIFYDGRVMTPRLMQGRNDASHASCLASPIALVALPEMTCIAVSITCAGSESNLSGARRSRAGTLRTQVRSRLHGALSARCRHHVASRKPRQLRLSHRRKNHLHRLLPRLLPRPEARARAGIPQNGCGYLSSRQCAAAAYEEYEMSSQPTDKPDFGAYSGAPTMKTRSAFRRLCRSAGRAGQSNA